MTTILYQITVMLTIIHPTKQNCPREVLPGQTNVIWYQTPTAENIESEPKCYNNETLITRNCSNSDWTPSFNELEPCTKIITYFGRTSCPPGYNRFTENNDDYCYHIGKFAPWDYPCFDSGGSSVITDLTPTELTFLLNNLKAINISRYFWLPAQKQSLFSSIVWRIPGPNWGKVVTWNQHLRLQDFFFKNCLLLDIEESMLITDFCTKSYPSFCFFINNMYYPAECPTGFYSFRFTLEDSACYGIAESNTPQGLPFYDFLNEKCSTPMSDNQDIDRFIFQKIAVLYELPDDTWCWFQSRENNSIRPSNNNTFQGIINNAGAVGLMQTNYSLTCMACKTEMIYRETELMFEYDYERNLLYLTIYHPAGLWKYDYNDKGFQCFSDAHGFVRVIDVSDNPFISVKPLQKDTELGHIEKIVYVIELITDSSAQYWCEAHTNNFSLIATDKIIVNPKGNNIHVYCLVIKYYTLSDEIRNVTDLTTLVANITEIFDAEKVLIMDIFDYKPDQMFILLHLHIAIEDIYDNEAVNVIATYKILTTISESNLQHYNYTFVNLSSSMYCLPTFSINTFTLDWEMTQIGHITAPKQFCLQSNGLPVNRHCIGSYKIGGTWGKVEGQCDNTYEPSTTTTFLYNFVKLPTSWPIFQFLTEGLNFVFDDPDVIIPADIYYLSMSLQQISQIAQENFTSLDTTDIEHLAWIMDRIMILDCEYLRLAQTLNSTNVIVDSISDIIEIILRKNLNDTNNVSLSTVSPHQLVVNPQFIVQITYPDFNNITGIAIGSSTNSDDFTNTKIYPLYKNTTLEDVLAIENLEIATWLPTKMLDSLQIYNNSEDAGERYDNFHIIITIYHNDAVFQEIHNYRHVVNSRIVGVTIPGYMSNFNYPVPILFKQINNTMKSFCGYWDFQSQQPNYIPGSWQRKGCFTVKSSNNVTVCECYHLTHFGHLVYNNAIEENVSINKGHAVALNVITLTGSFLSIFGIIGIWTTALIFSNWRKKASTKVLLQLSTAIALPLVFIVIFNLENSMFTIKDERYIIDTNKEVQCIVLGALLHFSILASFMWMLITAVLQFIRYVRVLGVRRPARFMFKFTLIGWGSPLIPVIMTLVLDCHNYIPAPATFRKICYPSGYYLIVAALVPMCLILIINIGLFLSVLYAISRKSNVQMKNTDMDLVGAQLRVSIFLFFLLGLTWVFGIFSFSNNLMWSYLFCLTSTLQGFVLFIYFIICDPSTRHLWVTFMTPQFNSNSSRNSITSISSG